MSISILTNVSSLSAQNQLNLTSMNLQRTLQQLASGSRINSGADDAAGLAIADGLSANQAALTQSAKNATDGVGALQVADGALSQITALLNRAVTLATEASNSTVGSSQLTAIDSEFTAIKTEIDNINGTTNFNGQAVFGGRIAVYTSDGSASGSNTISATVTATDSTTLGINSDDLTSASNAQAALTDITSAIATVAGQRGTLGGTIEQLQAASSVMSTENQNLASAESNIRSADMGQTVANMTKFNILQQTGMAALQQSNQAQQSVLKLLQ